MSDNNTTKRGQERSGRPFYQLPAHYKPCGTIIKETRLQLQSSQSRTQAQQQESGTGAVIMEKGQQYHHPTATAPPPVPVPVPVGSGSATLIRPVHTKRPFTPFHGEALLWGTSGRKRPPSAITLARLILDEGGEGEQGESGGSRPDSSSPAPLTPSGAPAPATAAVSFEATTLQSGIKALHLTNAGENEEPNEGHIFEEVIQALKEPTADLLPLLRKFAVQMGRHRQRRPSPTKKWPQQQPKLLKLLFRVVERNQNDGDLLFWSSYILLHIGVNGNNLTTVYKMIFKASKCKDYMETIRETDYIEIFLESFRGLSRRALHQTHACTEALIYGYGILKFLLYKERVEEESQRREGGDGEGEGEGGCEGEGGGLLERRLLDLNLIEIMATHLSLLNEEMQTKEIVPETVLNSVFQLTSVLRVLVAVPGAIGGIIATGVMTQVCAALNCPAVLSDVDVVTNIVRVLSIASEMQAAVEIMPSALSPTAIVQIVQMWHAQQQVLVRFMYCLGNLVVAPEGPHFGRRLFTEPLFHQLMIQVICFYLEGGGGTDDENHDVLIKTLRFIANWSLDPEIGTELSRDEKLAEVLITILQTHTQSQTETNANGESPHELLLCTVATLNNLSYYQTAVAVAVEPDDEPRLVEALLPYLGWADLEMRTEVVKVLGNLTRNVGGAHARARAACSEYIGSLLLSLEERDAEELLYATLGLLINVVADFDCKNEFIRKQGLHYLIDLLNDDDDDDEKPGVRLCLMISQLVWNLSAAFIEAEVGHAFHFHPEEINELCEALRNKMDEYAHTDDVDTDSVDRRDFLALATKLCDELCRERSGAAKINTGVRA